MPDSIIEVRPTLVTPILGFVAAKGANLDNGARPFSNSTRWILDIEEFSHPLEIQLLDFRSRRPLDPDVITLSLLPRSQSFYEVRPFASIIRGGSFTLQGCWSAQRLTCALRVSVDALHTSTR